MSYSLWVLSGLWLSLVVSRLQPIDSPDLPEPVRRRFLTGAVLGAVAGAYLLQIPAGLMGWSARPPGISIDALPLGDRTVLGGLLGAWLTVEAIKLRWLVRPPTGDRFALLLAVALACVRLGWASAGCCGGVACTAWWAWPGRYPVQIIEALFHASAALVLVLALRSGRGAGCLLATYLQLYAVARFMLEYWRGNPPVLAGLDWYQILSLALALLTASTLARRCLTRPVLPAGPQATAAIPLPRAGS